MPDPVLLCASDLHLSEKMPATRADADWLETQRGYLQQVQQLCSKYQAPLVVAGDVFDRAAAGAPIVNLALRHLPERTYAVMGNHDVRHGRLDSIAAVAYGTLVEAGRIINLEYGKPVEVPGKWPLRLRGFPFSTEAEPLKKPHDMLLEVAIYHGYIWTPKTGGYPDAPERQRLKFLLPRLRGYDAVLIGDNHATIGHNLDKGKPGPSVFNVGGFMRRASSEKDHRPCVGLLHHDGSIVKHYLDTSGDRFAERDNVIEETTPDLAEFLAELEALGDAGLDFRAAVHRYLEREEVEADVRKMVLEALGE